MLTGLGDLAEASCGQQEHGGASVLRGGHHCPGPVKKRAEGRDFYAFRVIGKPVEAWLRLHPVIRACRAPPNVEDGRLS